MQDINENLTCSFNTNKKTFAKNLIAFSLTILLLLPDVKIPTRAEHSVTSSRLRLIIFGKNSSKSFSVLTFSVNLSFSKVSLVSSTFS